MSMVQNHRMAQPAVHSTTARLPAFGRLQALGLSEPWQAAVYLPSSFLDGIGADESLRVPFEGRLIRRLRVVTRPQVTLRAGRLPMLRFNVQDSSGQELRTTVFGDPDEWLPALAVGAHVLGEVSAKIFAGEVYLTLHKRYQDSLAGRMLPVYPLATSKIVEQGVLREMIARQLPQAIPFAADHIRHQLQGIAPLEAIMSAIGAGGWTLEMLLEQAHYPHDPDYAEGARETLFRLAALAALHSAAAARPGQEANAFDLPDIPARIGQLPFSLTQDQATAVREIASQISSNPKPLFHVVFGDVGSGKSACYQVIAAAAAGVGRTTVALFPTGILAEEQFKSFSSTFPDIRTALVTAESEREGAAGASVVFGTSALLHRKIDAPDLLVIDEQHKWSRGQREKLAGPKTHVIEMSATCIPRSQALMRYGHITVSQLRQGHTDKHIVTKLWQGKEEAARLFAEIKQDVSEGHLVLIVYPKRKALGKNQPGGAGQDRSTVGRGMEKWDAHFPGLVRTVTSDSTQEEVSAALADIRSGKARILVATTVIEVGIDLPGLRRMIVIEPQRHGLSGLHQLRGRLARQGGEGLFHLVSNTRLPETSRLRVEALLRSNDGFEIAEMDLRLRGPGDLRAESRRQAGADGNFLIGQPVGLSIYDEMSQVLTRLQAGVPPAHDGWG